MAKKSPDRIEDDEDTENKGSGIGALIWIIPIIAIILLGWIMYIWFTFDPNESIMGATLDDWRYGSIFILMILIVILILVHPSGKQTGKTESSKRSVSGKSKKAKPSGASDSKSTKMVVIESMETEKKPEKVKEVKMEPLEFKAKPEGKGEVDADIADAEIIAPPAKKVSPEILEYPKKIEGGIYGDTFIKVDDGTTLKLRTQVVEDVYLA
jgi:hypothetical protein